MSIYEQVEDVRQLLSKPDFFTGLVLLAIGLLIIGASPHHSCTEAFSKLSKIERTGLAGLGFYRSSSVKVLKQRVGRHEFLKACTSC